MHSDAEASQDVALIACCGRETCELSQVVRIRLVVPSAGDCEHERLDLSVTDREVLHRLEPRPHFSHGMRRVIRRQQPEFDDKSVAAFQRPFKNAPNDLTHVMPRRVQEDPAFGPGSSFDTSKGIHHHDLFSPGLAIRIEVNEIGH
jgi:hypothetical protein